MFLDTLLLQTYSEDFRFWRWFLWLRTVLQNAMPYSPIEVHQCFWGTCCFHLHSQTVSQASVQQQMGRKQNLLVTHLLLICLVSNLEDEASMLLQNAAWDYSVTSQKTALFLQALPTMAHNLLYRTSGKSQNEFKSYSRGMACSSCYLHTYIYTYNCGCISHLHELASHSPLGLNLTDDTALVCPASVNFNV
jgi:hypothetical protein